MDVVSLFSFGTLSFGPPLYFCASDNSTVFDQIGSWEARTQGAWKEARAPTWTSCMITRGAGVKIFCMTWTWTWTSCMIIRGAGVKIFCRVDRHLIPARVGVSLPQVHPITRHTEHCQPTMQVYNCHTEHCQTTMQVYKWKASFKVHPAEHIIGLIPFSVPN